MADSQLVALVKLTPKEAVAYLKQRDQLTQSFNWQDVWQEEHAHQFTVSRLANLDILESMRDGILSSVKGDSSRLDWTKNAKELLIQAGWWGKKSLSDPTTGEIVTTTFDPPRLKLIFDTNTRMAYSAGLWQRIERNKLTHPYIRYITRGDERVRESHSRWNNLTLPVDHPLWKIIFPPNGWRCRCRVMSISQADYDAGLAPNGERLNKIAPVIEMVPWTNKRTGKTLHVPAGIDPGFGYNPGMARADSLSLVETQKLTQVSAELADAYNNSMKLPNYQNAVIDERKLLDYALNVEHPVGGNKARRIRAALGYDASNASEIIAAIRAAIITNTAIECTEIQWGRVFTVDFPLTGVSGEVIVRTSWIIENDVPRMTSFYVKES